MSAIGPLRLPAVIFDGPQTRVSPARSPRVPRRGTRVRRVATVGGWKVYLATAGR
jgi:hypothetical protein